MKELTISDLLKYQTFGRTSTNYKFYKLNYPVLLKYTKIAPVSIKINELLYIIKNNITSEIVCECGNRCSLSVDGVY